jgi:hypothetical protein
MVEIVKGNSYCVVDSSRWTRFIYLLINFTFLSTHMLCSNSLTLKPLNLTLVRAPKCCKLVIGKKKV